MTNPELERLAILSEELCEAGQVIGKIIRHGYESGHPDGGPSNRTLLEYELGDVRAALELLFEAGDLADRVISDRIYGKLLKLQLYTHNQNELLNNVIARYTP